MQFKIKNTDVKISFSFFAVFLLGAVSDTFGVFLMSFAASLIHELTHIIFILLFKARVTSFSISVFGGNIRRETLCDIGNVKECVISFSAPLLNIIVGSFFIFLSDKTFLFGALNLFLGIFNIMPFYSFDGGRGLFYLLTIRFSYKTAHKIITAASVTVTVCFSFVSVFIFFNYSKNYWLLILSVYMILSIVLGSQDRKNKL